ncbi:MAG: xanthine dehydrogenase family protein subunit M [Betaproteobacteria bacterium]|nr:xanthine dehydrogenase family protein subunit M [Betaproteobacteria bacterium]
MTPFELLEPKSLKEAIGLLDPEDASVRPIAGGTATMLMMKGGFLRPRRLVSLRRIEERYSRIETGPKGELRIGALVTLSALERSAEAKRRVPVLAQALKTLANVRVRNVATVGGHLAHGDPHQDLPPVFVSLGAHIVALGPKGERTIPVEELITGYYETVLERNELIAELIVPAQTDRRSVYVKCTTRSADDWPCLGVAVSMASDKLAVREASVAISAATERPVRLRAVESLLRGASVDDALLRRAGDAAVDEATLFADAQGSVAYKKQLLRVHVARAVRRALEAASGSAH